MKKDFDEDKEKRIRLLSHYNSISDSGDISEVRSLFTNSDEKDEDLVAH